MAEPLPSSAHLVEHAHKRPDVLDVVAQGTFGAKVWKRLSRKISVLHGTKLRPIIRKRWRADMRTDFTPTEEKSTS